MYYKCPRCGILSESPDTDDERHSWCPRCGSPVTREDHDHPFFDSTSKQEFAFGTILVIALIVGVLGLLSRWG